MVQFTHKISKKKNQKKCLKTWKHIKKISRWSEIKKKKEKKKNSYFKKKQQHNFKKIWKNKNKKKEKKTKF